MKVAIPYALAAIGSLVTLTQAQGLEDDACPVETSTEPTCAPTTTTLTVTETAPASTVTVTKPATTVTVTATVRASSRCSIPVSSQTTTPSNAPCPVRPDCPPVGLNIDYYSNPFGYNGYTSTTAGQSARQVLPPSYYITEGLTSISSSLTNVTYIPQDYASDVTGYPEVYPNPSEPQVPYYVGYKRTVNGGITVDGNNYTLVYSGFYRAPSTGTYTICASADNIDYTYFGSGDAFNCFGGHPDPNAKSLTAAAPGAFYNNPISCGKVSLFAGEFYPIRTVMGNGNGVSAFNLTIQAPGGSNLHDNSGLLYPLECRL